jgi:flavin reductase (DIM6/NTAB) family NADH-FMN oxidoreductase RutF
VTYNNVVAALRPFTIGVMSAREEAPALEGERWRLCMRERREPDRLLGVIHLRMAHGIPLPEHRFNLFETSGYENYCVPALSLQLYYLQQQGRAAWRRRRNPYNFQMTRTDLRCSYVFYICPRPVVLVSVEHEDAGNLFPMDLIGPTDSPWFSMALRSTSPAVRLMQQSRRMALASVPFEYKNVAYELGKHHRKTNIDWTGLPLKMTRSPLFGLRVPEVALRLREVHVEEFREVGSHVLFITSIERETAGSEGLQLFHRYGSYRQASGEC